jgi:hypothetical protein
MLWFNIVANDSCLKKIILKKEKKMKIVMNTMLTVLMTISLSGCFFHVPRGADGEIMYGGIVEANTFKLKCLQLLETAERRGYDHDWCRFQGNKITYCPLGSAEKMTVGQTYWVYTNDFPSTKGNTIGTRDGGINDFSRVDAQECEMPW